MNIEFDRAQAREARRVEIEHLLKQYPDVEPTKLDTLVTWFTREASAFDVAKLSSIDDLKDAYSAFQKDHLDQGSDKKMLVRTMLGVAIAAAVGAYMYMM